MMAFCIFSGDSCKSLAMVGREVLRMVESNICIKIEVAKMMGSNFLVEVVCVIVPSKCANDVIQVKLRFLRHFKLHFRDFVKGMTWLLHFLAWCGVCRFIGSLVHWLAKRNLYGFAPLRSLSSRA